MRILSVGTPLRRPALMAIVVAAVAAATIAGPGQASDLQPETIDAFLRKTVEAYRIPGLAVAVVDDRTVLLLSAYGGATPAGRITANTPFLLGSTTKAFTALAVMRLVERGQVELDAPVARYLPEFRVATPGAEKSITIRHLLNHTSGLSDEGMPFTSAGGTSLADELVLLRQCRPKAAPGRTFAYFNGNYRILGLVIERVSGATYGDFLAAEIFRPLGMTASAAGAVVLDRIPVGHGEIFGVPFARKQEYRPGALPSGYVASSAADLARFLMAELRAGGGAPGALSPETVRATWQPPGNRDEGYAMGWLVRARPGRPSLLAHGGSLESYQSFLCVDPQRKVAFAFLMNQGGFLPSVRAFSTLRDGLVGIMDGEQPDPGPGVWPVILVAACFLLTAAVEVSLTVRLKSWAAGMIHTRGWRRWVGLALELAVSCALAVVLYRSWTMALNLLPELFLLLWIMIVFGVLRSAAKAWILATRRPS